MATSAVAAAIVCSALVVLDTVTGPQFELSAHRRLNRSGGGSLGDFFAPFSPSDDVHRWGRVEMSAICKTKRAVAAAAPRRVYIDFGANWANTLRLYEQIGCVGSGEGVEQGEMDTSAPPWEVYAFEFSPGMVGFNAEVVDWLNGYRTVKPEIPVPEGGSSMQTWRLFGRRTGCMCVSPKKRLKCIRNASADRIAAMWANFRGQVARLNSSELVQRALIEAKMPPLRNKWRPRFTFIPAAVSNRTGWIDIKSHLLGIIRDRTHDHDPNAFVQMRLPIVDVVTWIAESFRPEDWVVLKMDIEGAEFNILPELIERGGLPLVDMLAWECHPHREHVNGQCGQIRDQFTRAGIPVIVEGTHYIGYDKRYVTDFADGFPLPPPDSAELQKVCREVGE